MLKCISSLNHLLGKNLKLCFLSCLSMQMIILNDRFQNKDCEKKIYGLRVYIQLWELQLQELENSKQKEYLNIKQTKKVSAFPNNTLRQLLPICLYQTKWVTKGEWDVWADFVQLHQDPIHGTSFVPSWYRSSSFPAPISSICNSKSEECLYLLLSTSCLCWEHWCQEKL